MMYRDICSVLAYLDKTVMDEQAHVPYTYVNPKWISYDNEAAFLSKVILIIDVLKKYKCYVVIRICLLL